MALDNTASPYYYGKFRQDVIDQKIPVNEQVSLQMLPTFREAHTPFQITRTLLMTLFGVSGGSLRSRVKSESALRFG